MRTGTLLLRKCLFDQRRCGDSIFTSTSVIHKGVVNFIMKTRLIICIIAFYITVLVCLGDSIQQLMADKETIIKIAASGKLIQCSAAIDVILLMDGSYSIGKGSFERSKHFASKVCDVLDINPDRVQIGVIQYSSKPKLEFALDAYPTREEAKEAIKNIHFRGGSTEIGRAIKHVLRKGFQGGRNEVPKIMILLTDGKSQDNIIPPAVFAKKSGITLFAVGIKHPQWKVLHSVASEPSEMYVFFAEHYDDAVNGLYTTLTQSTVCNDVPPSCYVESRNCQRTTIEAQKEYKGNHICWKGKNTGFYVKPMASICPVYGWKRVESKIHSQCHRTLCPDPCESNPCLNGGTCITESVEEFSCLCPLGYGGDKHCAGNRYLKNAREREIFILTVGRSSRLFNEMNLITGDSRLVFTFSDPQELYGKVMELRTKICGLNTAGCYSKTLDLVFALDASHKVGRHDFRHIKGFVKNIISQFDIDADLTQIGLVIYSDKPRTVFNLDTFDSEGKMKKSLSLAPYLGGNAWTGKALQYITEDTFSAQKGARLGVQKAVVLITDGQSTDEVTTVAEQLRRHGVTVLLTGVGEAQSQTLLRIAGNPKFMIPVPTYEHLKHYEANLVHKICEGLSQHMFFWP
ncbi:von Willebrand factor A domain-containing protein 2-like isoform X4 [Acipenser ruthenus]|uniref:von Willebrand factor A domain-containing protein 2-like isoform X4 n=1 Tax=Acipenser ruthenus TaxID=7906 RepID=UPI002741123A|nr:von Willebrand factor A domain-containing protein 2-like isoform X4 [Acipenser ruthenus]